jgi:hypothetical protein
VNRYWGTTGGNQDTQTIGYSTKYGMFCTNGYAEGMFSYSFDFINNNKSFSPEDLDIVKGSPGDRRDLLNIEIILSRNFSGILSPNDCLIILS